MIHTPVMVVARTVVVVVAAAAHLVVGWFCLASGLLAPLWAVVLLLVVWAALLVPGIQLARRRSWWVLAVPVVAAGIWLLVMTVGEAVLGWTP